MVNSRDRLEKISQGFMEARVLITATELDLFSAIGRLSLTAAEVADRTGARPVPMERLLNALVSMKVVLKNRGKFRNTAAALRYLTADSPEPLQNIMRHRGGMWKSWSRLTDIVRTGKVKRRKKSSDDTRNFILGMADVARVSAEEAGNLLYWELSKSSRLLDLGGGPGFYACHFARRHPDLKVTLFDLPDVLDLARGVVKEQGVAGRVRLKPGDALGPDSPGRGFDIAFLSNFVHCFKPKDARRVVEKAAGAVRKGGYVAIKEFCLEKDGTAPPFTALFSINMLTADAGDSYPAALLKEWMTGAGLGSIRHATLATASNLLVGEKMKTAPRSRARRK